ncbi:hypothetical protein HNY73_000477 [Argiope bruennichi]|uniref:Uncharacterized protein n=1 Tax=Argiope bruennichi TaxID=94029 RepID=A0A8T0G208_ARGBR|nr:hypothetical protein HNY73_000477 [Argiope bruennichi]
MAFLNRALKIDLFSLTEELGIETDPSNKVVDLIRKIKEFPDIDLDFVKDRYEVIVEERKTEKERGVEAELQAERQREREFELERLRISNSSEINSSHSSRNENSRPRRDIKHLMPKFDSASVDIVTRNYVSNADFTGEVIWVKQPLDLDLRCLPLARVKLNSPEFGEVVTKAAIVDSSLDQGIYLLSNATAELLNKRISIATVNAGTTRSQKKGENAKGDGKARRIESGTGGHQYKAPNNVMNNIVPDSASLRSATRSPTIDMSTNRNMFNVSTAVSTAINSTPVIAVPPMSTTGVIGKHGQPQGSALPTNRMTATSGKTSQYSVPQHSRLIFNLDNKSLITCNLSNSSSTNVVSKCCKKCSSSTNSNCCCCSSSVSITLSPTYQRLGLQLLLKLHRSLNKKLELDHKPVCWFLEEN